MNKIEKISREALNLLNYSKDTAVSSLSLANSEGMLGTKLSDEQLSKVVSLLENSLSQGYLKGINSFQKSTSVILEKEEPNGIFGVRKKK